MPPLLTLGGGTGFSNIDANFGGRCLRTNLPTEGSLRKTNVNIAKRTTSKKEFGFAATRSTLSSGMEEPTTGVACSCQVGDPAAEVVGLSIGDSGWAEPWRLAGFAALSELLRLTEAAAGAGVAVPNERLVSSTGGSSAAGAAASPPTTSGAASSADGTAATAAGTVTAAGSSAFLVPFKDNPFFKLRSMLEEY